MQQSQYKSRGAEKFLSFLCGLCKKCTYPKVNLYMICDLI